MKIANSRLLVISSILLSIGIFVLAYMYDPYATSYSQNDGVLVYAFIPAAVVFALRYASSKVMTQVNLLKESAQTLGYTYQESMSVDGLPGKLFALGKDRTAVDVCTGMHGVFPLKIFIYRYATTINWQYQFPSQMVWYISLNKTLPHLIFNWWPLGQPPDLELAVLEGDFSKKFNVYVAKDAQSWVQQVFQPNVMEAIKTSYDDFGFEVIEGNLYLMHDLVPIRRSNTSEAWIALNNRALAFSDVLIAELLGE
jgi:hypothetical protein